MYFQSNYFILSIYYIDDESFAIRDPELIQKVDERQYSHQNVFNFQNLKLEQITFFPRGAQRKGVFILIVCDTIIHALSATVSIPARYVHFNNLWPILTKFIKSDSASVFSLNAFL